MMIFVCIHSNVIISTYFKVIQYKSKTQTLKLLVCETNRKPPVPVGFSILRAVEVFSYYMLKHLDPREDVCMVSKFKLYQLLPNMDRTFITANLKI